VVVCAFAVGAYVTTSGHKTQVIVVTKTVPAGATIEPADLTAVGIAADNKVSAIPAAEASQVVGRVANETLTPGSLLARANIATGPVVPAGDSIIGLALKPGTFPASLEAGDTVTVMSTPAQTTATTAASPAGAVEAAKVTVYSVGASPDGQTTLVSIIVPTGEALSVASAGASGNISVALVGGGG
jgi:hypothetical protein